MEPELEEVNDEETTKIREELSTMSFAELQKLKEKLGTKVYNEAMFGASSSSKKHFKRENKNRPREMSSKRPVPLMREILPVKKDAPRDPRFDGLCGTFDEKVFKSRYRFVSEFRVQELKQLKDELRNTTDDERKSQIKYLIQRMENQLREEELKKKKEEREREDKEAQSQALMEGKKPFFRKKSEQRIVDLIDRFEDLKKKGKVGKSIEKYRKKMVQKNRKRLPDQ